MKKIKRLEQIQLIHQRIFDENTGSPKELANQIHISIRSMHNLIEDLKDLGAKVHYSRRRSTYYYKEDFDLQINISLTVIQNGQSRNLYGGSYFLKENYFAARFLQGTKLCL